MKNILPLSLALLGLLAVSGSSQAQTIVWGTAQTMVGDTDVQSLGTYLDAASFYSSSVTVNGVTFNPLSGNRIAGETDASGDISITSPGDNPGAYGPAFTTTSPSSTDYSHLTSVIGFGYFQTGLVTLSNLTIGDTYAVETWSYYTPGAGNTITTMTGSTSVTLDPSLGQYAIGTFTATSATETFNYNYNTGYGVINAVSVFDTTPEPSTVALFAVAITGLAFQLGRKRRSLV